ncbi:hypothetical protein QBC38DRAFT_52525 [Podospora fimiseda]|uniref:Hydrolase n=1 Tax=Podospora fimiseda TaxID=252190 RepID=A0AAN7BHI4_9PEZI|nr:hypothetical protein QBC38DRAFT_52525 [Podospora fimiseda]
MKLRFQLQHHIMEKEAIINYRPAETPRRRGPSTTLIPITSILFGILFLGSLPNIRFWDFGSIPSSSSSTATSEYDPNNPWESIPSSPQLKWHPCYPSFLPYNFLCARLSLPMTYTSSNSASRVSIALLLLPGTNSSKPPLLINPGGPGGSGNQLVLLVGKQIQDVFGEDQSILGFDPRGVGYSTPLADCWANKHEPASAGFMRRVEFETVQSAYGFMNDSDVSLKYLSSGQKAVNDLCREGGKEVIKYVGTKYVARDMLGIIDAWDQSSVKFKGDKREKAKLHYWGFSYGTYLGMTFAKMFPDRVGRVVLDGVVDSDYYEKEIWKESLLDADEIWERFFEYCFGVEKDCAFWKEGEDTKGMKKRFERVLRELDDAEEGPITFTHPKWFYPVVLRKSYFRLIIFGTLKMPVLTWPALAEVLRILEERRYGDLSVMFGDRRLLCLLPGGNLPFNVVSDAQRAIMCGDKDEGHRMNLTIPQIRDAFGKMAKTSQFTDIWLGLMLQCNGWDISKPYRLEYEVEKQWIESSNGRAQINTSFPILFMSTTLDPVTPLLAAVKMSLRFKDAGLIELEAEGHCTVGSAASLCVAKVVRDYVLHGKVPPPAEVNGKQYLDGKWTKCEADERPWKRVGSLSVRYKEDAALMDAFKKVQRGMAAVGQFEPAIRNSMTVPRMSTEDLLSIFGEV